MALRAVGGDFDPQVEFEDGSGDLCLCWRGCLSFVGDLAAEKEAALQRILFPPGASPAYAPRSGSCWLCGETTCNLSVESATPTQQAFLDVPALEEMTKESLHRWMVTQKGIPTREREGRTELEGYFINPRNWTVKAPPTAAQVCCRGHVVIRRHYIIVSMYYD